MSNRLATRIGLPSAEERPADAFDVVAFEEPAVGALARTKGSLFVLAQLTGGTPQLERATREVITALTREYYYDLSAGVRVALGKALRSEALVWAMNERMRGRPGATIVLLGMAVSVGRAGA